MIATETQAPAADAAPVRLSDLARALELPPTARRTIIEQRLVTPLEPVRRGRPTRISPADAERLNKAATIAIAVGCSIVIVLKVLSAAARP